MEIYIFQVFWSIYLKVELCSFHLVSKQFDPLAAPLLQRAKLSNSSPWPSRFR